MGSKLLWGFTLGLITGLLLAPDKGSETRQRISRKANDLKDKFDDLVDSISEKLESFKNEAETKARSAKTEAQSFAGDVRNGTR
jgi:gas vesicle protein